MFITQETTGNKLLKYSCHKFWILIQPNRRLIRDHTVDKHHGPPPGLPRLPEPALPKYNQKYHADILKQILIHQKPETPKPDQGAKVDNIHLASRPTFSVASITAFFFAKKI